MKYGPERHIWALKNWPVCHAPIAESRMIDSSRVSSGDLHGTTTPSQQILRISYSATARWYWVNHYQVRKMFMHHFTNVEINRSRCKSRRLSQVLRHAGFIARIESHARAYFTVSRCVYDPGALVTGKFPRIFKLSFWLSGSIVVTIQSEATLENPCKLTDMDFCNPTMTSSNGNISALLALCEGNSPVTGEFPSQRPVTWGFDVFFDLLLNKRLCQQSRRRRFQTP